MNRSTHWAQVLQVLHRAHATLPGCVPAVMVGGIPAGTIPRPVVDLTATDQAVEHWIECGEWPRLVDDVAAELHVRIDAAKTQLRRLVKENVVCPALPDALALLLIESWHGMVGRGR